MFDDAHIIARTGNPSGTEWTGTAPLITPEPWMQDAVCVEVDPELFFPSVGDAETAALARQVCGGCPVAAECLDYAMRTSQTHGVWGGLSPKQRDALRSGRTGARRGRLCTREGCDNKHSAKGLCSRHYRQARREGSL